MRRQLEKLGLRKVLIGILIGLFVGSFLRIPLLGAVIGGLIGANIITKLKRSKKPDFVDIPVDKPDKKDFWINLAVIIFVLVSLLYFFRPWLHTFLMVFYTNPSLIVLILGIIITVAAFLKNWKVLGIIFLVISISSFCVLVLNNVIVENYIAKEQTYTKIDAMYDSAGIRMLPKAVALRYLEDSLQKSREKVGDINLLSINDSLVWAAPRIPDGFFIYFTQPVNGLMTANAQLTTRDTKLITKKLTIGEDIGIMDNIYWHLYKKHYFINLGDVYYIMENNSILTVAPIIEYRFKFPVMVPYFSGVFVTDEQGITQKYLPDEIQYIHYFKNNRVFPEELARLYVDAYKYHLGVMNAWFQHKDQIEITDVYDQFNRQPFLMPTADGLKWVVATEPYGESYGVFKIFFVDAITGEIALVEMNEDETLTGPVSAVSYIKREFPRIDWENARVVEPRPYVVDNTLYWMVSVTPREFAGVSYTVFVNSKNNDVIAFSKDSNVYDFIAKGVEETKAVEEEAEKETVEERGEINATAEEDTEKQKQEIIKNIEEQLEQLKKLMEK